MKYLEAPRRNVGGSHWKLSLESRCLAEADVLLLNKIAKTACMKPFVSSVNCMGETLRKELFLIEVSGRALLVDRATGQLYTPDGDCLSSVDLHLNLIPSAAEVESAEFA